MNVIVPDLLAGGDNDLALIEPDNDRRVTYAELRGEVDELAGRLAGWGIGRGDRVSLVVPEGPQFVRALLAVTAVGATAAPLNPSYTEEEFRFYLDDLAPRLVLSVAGEAGAARRASPSTALLDLDGPEFAA